MHSLVARFTARLYKFSPLGYAITLMVLAMASFSLMNTLIHLLGQALPVPQSVFLRNVMSVALLAPWVLTHGLHTLRTERISGHLWRSGLGTVAMLMWFYSLNIMPVTQATAVSFTTPLFVSLFALMFLGEHAGWRRWTALVLGFAGTLVILRPDVHGISQAALIVLASSAIMAATSIVVKTLTRTEHPNVIVMYMAVFMTLFSAPLGLYFWETPTLQQLVIIFGIAACSTGAHLLITRAYIHATMVVLMPFDFTRLIFTALFAYLLFDETLSVNTVLGSAMIVASAAYITWREQRKKANV